MKDSTVLVTGGTGSFGGTMVRHLLSQGCADIRVFSRDESKQDEMRNELDDPRVHFYIGDVRDRDSVVQATRGVDFVFHAAALKQVPSCEFFPLQAVLTNVTGSANVIEAAARAGVSAVVCLSTDKAVYPVNAMGMTKALMEKTVQAYARVERKDGPRISCVRYGNVMFSRGSVIPRMIHQVRRGTPLTVTEPSMTRFMMALPEAVELVELAFNNAECGDLFVRKSPACTMGDLAVAIRNIFTSDVPIERIGVRHGEKLAETLVSREELVRSDDLGDYFRVRLDDRDLNYGKYFDHGDLSEGGVADYDSANAPRLDIAGIEKLLRSLPEVQRHLNEAGVGRA